MRPMVRVRRAAIWLWNQWRLRGPNRSNWRTSHSSLETRSCAALRQTRRRDMRHLILRLEAPLMSFGGDMIDANGPTLDFPLASLVIGLMANALGWTRAQS